MRFSPGFLKWFESFSAKYFGGAAGDSGSATPPPSPDPGTPVGVIRRSTAVPVQVGIDFGTSSTKIAYRPIGGPSRLVRPVFFQHGLAEYPNYCLPSVGAFDSAGRLLFGGDAVRHLANERWGAGLRRFKVILAGRHDAAFRDASADQAYADYLNASGHDQASCPPEVLTIAFLLYAMRSAAEAVERDLQGVDLQLSFNVCLPIDHAENSQMLHVFRKILHVAESIYYSDPLLHDWSHTGLLNRARDGWNSVSSATDLSVETGRVCAIPEAVAQVASYLGSLEKRSGVHAIIDFGAGTTDLSIFNLELPRRGANQSHWYAARNIPQGTARLEQIVVEHLDALGESTKSADAQAIFSILSAVAAPTQPAKYHRLESDVIDALHKLRVPGMNETWTKAFGWHLKKEPEWKGNAVQVLIAGGGSTIPRIPLEFSESWRQGWGPYPIRALPRPPDFDTSGGQVPFGRLAVAYGLTRPKPELDAFVLPSDAKDHTPPVLVRRDLSVDGDGRYPREDWFGRRTSG